jgi:putative SOS response-associated peptidase YedK
MRWWQLGKGSAQVCGKFTQMASWREVHAFSQPLTVTPSQPTELIVSTPMRFAQIMRLNANGERELASMRWGFADKKANAPLRPKHMHARAETVDKLPTFATAFAQARGILMVHTFNEGEELPSGKTKQWVITPKDGQPIALAVICEQWHNGPDVLDTFVQVTVPANALIARITDRMPAILPCEAWSVWLGEARAPVEEIKTLLRTYEDGGNWSMTEQPTSKPPRRPKGQQSLF